MKYSYKRILSLIEVGLKSVLKIGDLI